MDNNQVQLELGIYAIWDKKSQRYDTPFFAMNDIFAKRRFILMSDEKGSPITRWQGDFELHKVSRWNMYSGEIQLQDIEVLLEAKDIVPQD